MTATRAIVDSPQARKADLAAIHIGAKALGWGDEEYRDLLWTVCQVRSAGALDFTGRKRFLDHMRACGFKGSAQGHAQGVRKPWSREQKLVWSLWQQLADAGLVRARDRKALDAWVKAYIKVDRIEFMNRAQLDHCIAMLRQWVARRQEPT